MYGAIIIYDSIENSIKLLNSYKNNINNNGNIFILVNNEVNSIGDIKHDFLDIIAAASDLNLIYINTIVMPTERPIHSDLPDNVFYIVWLAKDKNHFFNKDAIREKHIWKDVEWGKRIKNYNPKGKDPGNVWIPTKDDGKANITEHILLDIHTAINRIDKCSRQIGLNTLLITSNAINYSALNNGIIIKQFTDKTTENLYKKKKYSFPTTEVPFNITGKIVWGTSEKMDQIKNNTIDVVITSPPYWDLKDYFKEGQIGQEDYNIYLNRLYCVWDGCYHKLKNSGSLWININIRTKNGKVILIPKDIVKQCKKIGFHYKGILIWHKSSGIPTNNKNIVDRHEYVLIFSKNEVLNVNSNIFEYKDYKNDKINSGLFWNINRKAGSVGKHFIHPAIYPNDLVSRIVKITTHENDFVLDPFLGSGTTLIAAIKEGRNCIGYEYNEGFKALIQSRIKNEIKDTDFKLEI